MDPIPLYIYKLFLPYRHYYVRAMFYSFIFFASYFDVWFTLSVNSLYHFRYEHLACIPKTKEIFSKDKICYKFNTMHKCRLLWNTYTQTYLESWCQLDLPIVGFVFERMWNIIFYAARKHRQDFSIIGLVVRQFLTIGKYLFLHSILKSDLYEVIAVW